MNTHNQVNKENKGIRLLFFSVLAVFTYAMTPTTGSATLSDLEKSSITNATLALPFIANNGQLDSQVKYYTPGINNTVYVTKDGKIIYSLPSRNTQNNNFTSIHDDNSGGWTLTETLIKSTPLPASQNPATTQVNYFIGNNPDKWHSQNESYHNITLGEAWPGINVDLYAKHNQVEKFFTINAGADPDLIQVKLQGANDLSLDDQGNLLIHTSPGIVRLTSPIAWQEIDNHRQAINVTYKLNGNTYGFKIGQYNPTHPLIIDPILQSTYLGGSANDIPYTLVIHPSSGKIYVAGVAESADFPGTTGGIQPSLNGASDLFIARYNAELTNLEQLTYLGGSSDDGQAAYYYD